MNMKKLLQLLLWLVFAVAAVFPLAAAGSRGGKHNYSRRELGVMTRLTARILAHNHYRQLPLSDELSGRLFNAVFDRFDSGRIFFLAPEIAEFKKQYFHRLDDDLKRGDSTFAFEVNRLFQRRYGEYREFAEKMLKKPIDFTVNEEIELDRSKSPFPENRREMEELWRKRLKNDVLYFRMLEKTLNLEAARNSKVAAELQAEKKWQPKSPVEKVLTRLRDVGNDINNREDTEILGIYLDTLARIYGPHSNYLPPKLDEDFDIHMSLSLTGIGATLTSDDGFIKVVELSPGGPAERSGQLKVNDRIIAVKEVSGETVDLIDMPVSKAVRYIRGPENSRVTLTVIPGDKGRSAMPKLIELVRAKIVLVDSVAKGEVKEKKRADGSMLRIGVLTLPGFYLDIEALRQGRDDVRRCSTDVRRILEDFKRRKVDGVIVDLRNNGGGSLPEAILMSGLFIPEGPVVQIRAGKSVDVQYDRDKNCVYSGPLVIMTSKLSASSSEIFCAALRDCHRALLVGDSRTFGKGTILLVEPLDEAMGLLDRKFPAGMVTFEKAMFYRIQGGSPQQLGIASDIVIPSVTEEMKVGEMFLDNHLPWDSIRAVRSQDYDTAFDDKVMQLKKNSAARIAASPEFRRLKARMERFRHHRDRKSVSLNEAVREREYQEEKSFEDELEKVAGEKRQKGVKQDIQLDEALNIAADYIRLHNNTGKK